MVYVQAMAWLAGGLKRIALVALGLLVALVVTELGVRLMEVRVIPDVEQVIVDTLNEVRRRFDYVFTTGGIGPTHDDITADCVARAFGLPLIVNLEARRILEAHYPPGQLTEARLRMARIPEGAQLIDNPVSAAPGFTLGNVHVMAGVPAIFEAMVAGVLPRLTGGDPVLSETLRIDRGEGDIAQPLARIDAEFAELSFGSYPFQKDGRYGANIVIRGTDTARIASARARLKSEFGDDAT